MIEPNPNSGCSFLSFVDTGGSFLSPPSPSPPRPPSSGVAGTSSFALFALPLEDLLNDASPSLVPTVTPDLLGLFLVLILLLSPTAVEAGDSILTVFFFFPFLSTSSPFPSPPPPEVRVLVDQAPTVGLPSIVRFLSIPGCAMGGRRGGEGEGFQCLKEERDCQSTIEGEGDFDRSRFEGERAGGTFVE